MSGKRSYGELYNKGSEQEIEAVFIKRWHEIKVVLYKHMWVKPIKVKMVDE